MRRLADDDATSCVCQGIRFITPLAHETRQVDDPTEAAQVLSLLSDRIADRKWLQRATCRMTLFRELGIATQRSIARDIVERSGRLPE
jgi:hypothetical protein